MKAKALTICQGGNSRSVALAYVLKYKYGVDALACSWETNTPETIKMLCEWAEAIFVMQPQFIESVPSDSRCKVKVIDVGPDKWFNGLHPELVALCDTLIKKAAVPA
jgi:predicted protein tyrosine phosphatase